VFRATRIVIATVLALAVAALPVVLDRCTESCEAHRDAVATAPSCHHGTSSTARFAPAPAPCGHDHSGPIATSAQGPRVADRAFDSMVAAVELPAALTPALFDRGAPAHAPPGSSPLTPDDRSRPLRI